MHLLEDADLDSGVLAVHSSVLVYLDSHLPLLLVVEALDHLAECALVYLLQYLEPVS